MRRIALSLLLIALLAGFASAQKAGDQAAATGDWKTAEANCSQGLRDGPNDPEKRSRWQSAARLRLGANAVQRGDHRAAFELLAQARAASNDAGPQAEAARLQPTIVSGAVKGAMQLQSQQRYPEALELLAAAAALDGAARPALEQVRGERDR